MILGFTICIHAGRVLGVRPSRCQHCGTGATNCSARFNGKTFTLRPLDSARGAHVIYENDFSPFSRRSDVHSTGRTQYYTHRNSHTGTPQPTDWRYFVFARAGTIIHRARALPHRLRRRKRTIHTHTHYGAQPPPPPPRTFPDRKITSRRREPSQLAILSYPPLPLPPRSVIAVLFWSSDCYLFICFFSYV